MKDAPTPIQRGDAALLESRHVCAFFNSRGESYRILLPFIGDGFDRGEKAVHIIGLDQRNDHLARLAEIGVNPISAMSCGQLELRTSADTYLEDGHFDPDKMLTTFQNLASGNGSNAFQRSRIVCNMEWAAEHPCHKHDLIEFESRVNDVWSQHEDMVICVYDLNKIGGDMVVDIMRTHPMIIIGGTLQQNPFYVSPQQFLQEFRLRGHE